MRLGKVVQEVEHLYSPQYRPRGVAIVMRSLSGWSTKIPACLNW